MWKSAVRRGIVTDRRRGRPHQAEAHLQHGKDGEVPYQNRRVMDIFLSIKMKPGRSPMWASRALSCARPRRPPTRRRIWFAGPTQIPDSFLFGSGLHIASFCAIFMRTTSTSPNGFQARGLLARECADAWLGRMAPKGRYDFRSCHLWRDCRATTRRLFPRAG